jgi:hypothetical protein
VTQIDVPGGRSGLVGLEPVLSGIEGLEFVHLDRRDVVRHRIVGDIVAAYERKSLTATLSTGTPGDGSSGPLPPNGSGPFGQAADTSDAGSVGRGKGAGGDSDDGGLGEP